MARDFVSQTFKARYSNAPIDHTSFTLGKMGHAAILADGEFVACDGIVLDSMLGIPAIRPRISRLLGKVAACDEVPPTGLCVQ